MPNLADEIFEFIRERAGEKINPYDLLENGGLDSLEFAQLCLDIEEKYDIGQINIPFYRRGSFETTELMPSVPTLTVQKFVNYVSNQINHKNSLKHVR